MPATVGALDALVLLVAILVGLALGALVAWASLLLRTGRPSRPQPCERGGRTRPPSRTESRLPPALVMASTLALFSLLVQFLIGVVPSVVPWEGPEGPLPGIPLIIASIVFVMVLTTAVGEWRGARQ